MIDQKSEPKSAAAATIRTKQRGFISDFFHSSVGRKMIVAVTGVILIVFVIGHLLGNLQIFLGPEWINSYSQHLRDLGPLLWLIRIFLLVTVILHIYFTILLAIENRRARPERYIDRQYVKASWASRHMVVSGLVVLAFIIFHRPQIQSAIPTPQTRSAQSLRRLFDDGLRISERLRVELLHRGFIPPHAPSHSLVIELLPIAWSE